MISDPTYRTGLREFWWMLSQDKACSQTVKKNYAPFLITLPWSKMSWVDGFIQTYTGLYSFWSNSHTRKFILTTFNPFLIIICAKDTEAIWTFLKCQTTQSPSLSDWIRTQIQMKASCLFWHVYNKSRTNIHKVSKSKDVHRCTQPETHKGG